MPYGTHTYKERCSASILRYCWEIRFCPSPNLHIVRAEVDRSVEVRTDVGHGEVSRGVRSDCRTVEEGA